MNLSHYQHRIERFLEQHLPPEQQGTLAIAMRYSTLNGGKRLRAALIYATAEDNNIALDKVDAAAAAIECIHAYSLIHDDLPAMDNDALRRGKPSCHIAFGEAEAILAGDALNTLAFEYLTHSPLPSSIQIEQIRLLSRAAGWAGMAGGQSMDMASTGKTIDIQQLQTIHQGKTGALIQAAILLSACASKHYPTWKNTYHHIGKHLGIAYQIHDDILDSTANTAQLGKTAGKDAQQNKNTYVQLLGITQAQDLLQKHHQLIKTLLTQLPQATALTTLIEKIFIRQY